MKKVILVLVVILILMSGLAISCGIAEDEAIEEPRIEEPTPTLIPEEVIQPEEVIEISADELLEIADAYIVRDERKEEFKNLVGKILRVEGEFRFDGESYFGVDAFLQSSRFLWPHLRLDGLSKPGLEADMVNISPPGLKPEYAIKIWDWIIKRGDLITVEGKFWGYSTYPYVCVELECYKVIIDGREFERTDR